MFPLLQVREREAECWLRCTCLWREYKAPRRCAASRIDWPLGFIKGTLKRNGSEYGYVENWKCLEIKKVVGYSGKCAEIRKIQIKRELFRPGSRKISKDGRSERMMKAWLKGRSVERRWLCRCWNCWQTTELSRLWNLGEELKSLNIKRQPWSPLQCCVVFGKTKERRDSGRYLKQWGMPWEDRKLKRANENE